MGLEGWDGAAWEAVGLEWDGFISDNLGSVARTNEIAVPDDVLPHLGAGDFLRVGNSVVNIVKVVGGGIVLGAALSKVTDKLKIEKVRRRDRRDPVFVCVGSVATIDKGPNHPPSWIFSCQFDAKPGWTSISPRVTLTSAGLPAGPEAWVMPSDDFIVVRADTGARMSLTVTVHGAPAELFMVGKWAIVAEATAYFEDSKEFVGGPRKAKKAFGVVGWDAIGAIPPPNA